MAPGIDGVKRPKQGFFPDPGTWYEGQDYGYNTSMNIFFFGNKNEKPNEEYSYQVCRGAREGLGKGWGRAGL